MILTHSQNHRFSAIFHVLYNSVSAPLLTDSNIYLLYKSKNNGQDQSSFIFIFYAAQLWVSAVITTMMETH